MSQASISQAEIREFTGAIDLLEPLLRQRNPIQKCNPEEAARLSKLSKAITILHDGPHSNAGPLRHTLEGDFEVHGKVLEVDKTIENDDTANSIWQVRLWETSPDADPDAQAHSFFVAETNGVVTTANYKDLTALWNAQDARKALEATAADMNGAPFMNVMLDGMDPEDLAAMMSLDLEARATTSIDSRSQEEIAIEADDRITPDRLELVLKPLGQIARRYWLVD